MYIHTHSLTHTYTVYGPGNTHKHTRSADIENTFYIERENTFCNSSFAYLGHDEHAHGVLLLIRNILAKKKNLKSQCPTLFVYKIRQGH